MASRPGISGNLEKSGNFESWSAGHPVFENLICVWYFCVWLCGEYSVLYISKTNKDRNTMKDNKDSINTNKDRKFYAQYQISVLVIFSGFHKMGSGG